MGGGRGVAVLGGGAGGLLTAIVLGNAGHDVVVLERDPAEPPDSDEEAWEDWDRRGVPQMRQPHDSRLERERSTNGPYRRVDAGISEGSRATTAPTSATTLHRAP